MSPPVQIKRPDVAEDVRTLSRRMQGDGKAPAELRELPVLGRELTDHDLYDPEGLPK
jgi:hypothetical protein